MSFSSRLIHSLAIVTPSDTGEDAFGQGDGLGSVTVLVPGLVQPRSAREMALINEGGPGVSDHVIFLLPQELSQAAYIRFDPDDGRRYEVHGIRSFEYGGSPHLEVDARLVGQPETVGAGS